MSYCPICRTAIRYDYVREREVCECDDHAKSSKKPNLDYYDDIVKIEDSLTKWIIKQYIDSIDN